MYAHLLVLRVNIHNGRLFVYIFYLKDERRLIVNLSLNFYQLKWIIFNSETQIFLLADSRPSGLVAYN